MVDFPRPGHNYNFVVTELLALQGKLCSYLLPLNFDQIHLESRDSF